MNSQTTYIVPPNAGPMIESLRGLGYSTQTAIADIIDNSISANACIIAIDFGWEGSNSWIRITDNGLGMDHGELLNAMKLGAQDPRATRTNTDLGRFGLGLKTASFSQAKRLTVASKKEGGSTNCLRWDLELITKENNDWILYQGPEVDSKEKISPLHSQDSGTIVLWENLDRVITDSFTVEDFFEVINRVKNHLEMTFHRFLQDKDISIKINGNTINAWDPFLTGHPSKAWESPISKLINTTGVVAQCHVLPHKDMFKDNADYEAAGGPNGWIDQQGFYIYRNKRLLVAGSWLGLGESNKKWVKDDPHRLARIRIDISNQTDAEWKINILKSIATPPVKLRQQLAKLATATRRKARQVFAQRGHLTPTTSNSTSKQSMKDIWQMKTSAKGHSYKIDRSQEFISALLAKSGSLRSEITTLLRLIEESVPVQKIWLDTAENHDVPLTGFTDSNIDEIKEAFLVVFQSLKSDGKLTNSEIKERLLRTHPFDQYQAAIVEMFQHQKELH